SWRLRWFKCGSLEVETDAQGDDPPMSTRLRVARYAVLTLIAVVMALPYIWMLSASFQQPSALSLTRFELIPSRPTLQNFVAAIEVVRVLRLFWNSLIVSSAGVLLQTSVCALAAYALARIPFPGAGTLLLIFIGTMMVPEEAIMIPLF